MICIIDGTVDVKYLSLGIWGKPVISYTIQSALDSNSFEAIYVVTKSPYIKYLVEELFHDRVVLKEEFLVNGLLIDGRAANILPESISRVVGSLKPNIMVNFFDYCTDPEENVIVDCSNNFELSLVLCNKRRKPVWLKEMVLKRIKDKLSIFNAESQYRNICLVGHSQFDQWQIEKICGYNIRNCGISGITTREYIDYVVEKINFGDDIIVILLGINDIALPLTAVEIAKDIMELITIIRMNELSSVYYLKTLHINGRLDRDNRKIDELNDIVHNILPDGVVWIGTEAMDDAFGNLNYKYTTDGLHLNIEGYKVLQMIIEQEVTK